MQADALLTTLDAGTVMAVSIACFRLKPGQPTPNPADWLDSKIYHGALRSIKNFRGNAERKSAPKLSRIEKPPSKN
jgi:hypothetical protein